MGIIKGLVLLGVIRIHDFTHHSLRTLRSLIKSVSQTTHGRHIKRICVSKQFGPSTLHLFAHMDAQVIKLIIINH